jgi:hypothetical protein
MKITETEKQAINDWLDRKNDLVKRFTCNHSIGLLHANKEDVGEFIVASVLISLLENEPKNA